MSEESRRLLVVAVAIVTLVGGAFVLWRHREEQRPQLVSAAVVYLPKGEAVARQVPSPVVEGVEVWAGVLLQIRQGKRPARFLCPFPQVLWQGEQISPEPLTAWPQRYGVLKAHWYTVEPAYFGAENVTPANADKLAFQDFPAPELGTDLKVLVDPEPHNDDFLTEPVLGNTLGGGFWRLKVKVSAYRNPEDLLPWATVASPGAGELLQVPALGRLTRVPEGIHPHVALGFRCGVFTFAEDVWRSGEGAWPGPLTPRELVAKLLVMTPQAIAALAATGDPLAHPWSAPQRLVGRRGGWLTEGGRPVRWGQDVRAGDALSWAGRWAVVWSDDGSGLLDDEDRVLLAWMQPARLVTLAKISAATRELNLFRVREQAP